MEGRLMTFSEFQQTRQGSENLGEILGDAMFWNCPGYAYLGRLWIEDTKEWSPNVRGYGKGRWFTMIDRTEIQSNSLEDCELPLYEFAMLKGWAE